jgi:tRNA nucleotidyltransferase (CCA-adding enzyme)
LRRRDFTVNAIALRITNNELRTSEPELVDPCDGMRDLKDGVIRMVAPDAFAEDPLRMLRACQFAARFEFALERGTFEAIKKNSALIGTVAAERIQQELTKMLTKAGQPSIGLWLMQRTGLLAQLIPELEAGVGITQPGGFHRYDVFQHSIRTVDHVPREKGLALRLAALLHDVAKPGCRQPDGAGVHFYGHDREGGTVARSVLERLRYSRDLADRVALLVRRHMFAYPETEKGLRRLIAKTGREGLYDLIDLRRADILAQGRTPDKATGLLDTFEQAATGELNNNPPFSLRDLAIDGNDLMREFGLKPGPEIGRVLDRLLEQVLEHPAKNAREQLLDEAASFLAGR